MTSSLVKVLRISGESLERFCEVVGGLGFLDEEADEVLLLTLGVDDRLIVTFGVRIYVMVPPL